MERLKELKLKREQNVIDFLKSKNYAPIKSHVNYIIEKRNEMGHTNVLIKFIEKKMIFHDIKLDDLPNFVCCYYFNDLKIKTSGDYIAMVLGDSLKTDGFKTRVDRNKLYISWEL